MKVHNFLLQFLKYFFSHKIYYEGNGKFTFNDFCYKFEHFVGVTVYSVHETFGRLLSFNKNIICRLEIQLC